MRKVKIAQVITRMDWGGSPDIVRIICSYLNPELYDITLVTGPTHYPSAKTKDFFNRFNHRLIIIPQLKRELNPILDLIALIKLYLLLRREKFDIVHSHTGKAGVLSRIAGFIAGRKIIIHTPHGHNFYGYGGFILSRIIIAIEKFIAHFTDKIIVLTELEKNDFLKFRIAGSEKIRLIYQGLELDRCLTLSTDRIKLKNSFKIGAEEVVVGMLARLEAIKGPEFFVLAAKEVSAQFSNAKFMVIGEGSLREKLERKVEELGLKNRFIFTGWRDDALEILSILDILVLPSLNEAVGMVLIEAQAMGVPVVATKVGGIPEVVRDNETAVLVPAQNTCELSNAINYLLRDEKKRLEMSKAARAWVSGKFRAQEMVDKISELYQELIKATK